MNSRNAQPFDFAVDGPVAPGFGFGVSRRTDGGGSVDALVSIHMVIICGEDVPQAAKCLAIASFVVVYFKLPVRLSETRKALD